VAGVYTEGMEVSPMENRDDGDEGLIFSANFYIISSFL
jgi:hypothetical protein